MYIDSHTHLYDTQFDLDRAEMISNAVQNGVEYMLLPNCDQHTIPGMKALATTFPRHCFPMIGLHPVYVKENYQEELEIVAQELASGKYVGIGEIGLDYYWDRSFDDLQQIAFEQQIDWALDYQLPIAIHTRDSVQAGIDTIRRKQNGNLNGVFHCFSGSLEEAKKIIDLGFYLGIGGVLTFKNSTLKNFVKQLPLDRLILETDAPYLAPMPFRGKRNESKYIPIIAAFLSDCLERDVAQIEEVTTANVKRLYPLLP